jgi:cytochrome c-type biogenesis protein CcmH
MYWIFWLIAALLIVFALGWPLAVMLRQRQQTQSRTEQVNLVIYRERLDELKQDLQNGAIEQAQFDEAKQELAGALLHDLKTAEHHEQHGGRLKGLRWPVVVAIAVLVPVLALVTFSRLSEQIQFIDTPVGDNSAEARQAANESRQLLGQLEQHPKQAKLWAQLGARYMEMQRPHEARQAYEKALHLGMDDPELLIRLAHAIGQVQRGNLSGEPTKLIQRALAKDPENPPALIWAGLASFQQGDFKSALVYWKKVEAGLGPQAPQRPMLERLINQAQQRLAGIAPAPQAPTAPQTPAAGAGAKQGASIKVTVALDPALKDKVKPDETLFILARAANGPPMPLAVVRRKVGDLPLELTLDDSQAMSPQMRLSSFDQVVVVARISRTGRPIAQPGDLYAQAGPVPLAKTDKVALTIDQVVKDDQ